MDKQKKMCCRITPRRVMGAILLATTAVNLVIVGAAFKVSFPGAVPTTPVAQTTTAVQTTDPATMTFFFLTATEADITQITLIPPDAPTETATFRPTDTLTSTFTNTALPSSTPCVPQYSWPIYYVQRGDTLSSLARATGSSVNELMLANCLPDPRINVGQRLYVPRLPIIPTNTNITPPNTPTVFQNPSACIDPDTQTIVFSVTPYDPEGISTITASYSIYSGQTGNQISLEAGTETYYGSGYPSGQYLMSTISYFFSATDNLGSVTKSVEFSADLQSCYLG